MTAAKTPWWEKRETFCPLTTESKGRVWHHHSKWEDAIAGMYRTITGKIRSIFLEQAIDFTGDHDLYGKFMLLVVENWPVSSEHNLSCKSLNRRAWVGHAACCYAIGVPEDITREAWGFLSNRQRKLANNQADIAIEEWEEKRGVYAKNYIRSKRIGGGKGENINRFRPIQQDIFEFLRRKGQHSNVAPCR
jgi:hypothetical protein